MPYCERCGEELPAGNNNFCPACGAPVVDEGPAVDQPRQLGDLAAAAGAGGRAAGADAGGRDDEAAKPGVKRLIVPIVAGALVAGALGAGYLLLGAGGEGANAGEAVVPELIGSTQDEAARALAGANLTVGEVKLESCDEHREGQVCESEPAAGEKVEPGDSVDLVISRGASGDGDKAKDDAKDNGSEQEPGAAPVEGTYLLPDSATRVYTESEVADLSDWDLVVARNEIFARHGRGFKDKKLQEHFDKQGWYTKKYSPEKFDALSPSPLSKTERANVDMLMRVEKSRKPADTGAQTSSGVSSTFVETARKALRIPDGLDGLSYSQISSSWWEGGGMTVYSISFYRNGQTIASASCKADGTPVTGILSYNGK